MMGWKIMIVLLLVITHSTSGQRPSAPTSVIMELEFINANPHITGRWNAPVSTTVEQYLLAVTVNGSSSFNTTMPANTTSASIFEVFPNIVQRRYTTYSLRVASIDNAGQSSFTEPVSIVSNLLQSASAIGGVREIVVSCVIAKSKPKALCTVVVSDNMEHHAYTFQTGETHVTLDYAPGEYHVSIRVHERIDGNLVITEEPISWSISVLPFTLSSSSTALFSFTMSSSPLPPSAATLLSTSPSSSSLTVSNENDDHGGDGGGDKVSAGTVMVTVLVCALILSLTVMFTVAALIWWKCHIDRKTTSDSTTAKVLEKPCVHSTVNTKTDDSSFCEELDTIKHERYSVVTVGGGKSRINSALTSNHSSYIEMHPRRASVDDLAAVNNVIMQSNPSYSNATNNLMI